MLQTLLNNTQDKLSKNPWSIVVDILNIYTEGDRTLMRSLLNMITLEYRFDHINYVSCHRFTRADDEVLLQRNPNCARALLYMSKIHFAMPRFPRIYHRLWIQLKPIITEWEMRCSTCFDEQFAFHILYNKPEVYVF